MMNCFFRTAFLLALSVGAAGFATAGQVSYRIVAYMDQYDQPAGFVEGSPSVFYGISGSVTTVGFSITPQGLMTILASFPSGQNIQSLFVAGSNGLFYSSVQLSDDPASVFSVTSKPGQQHVYPPQELGAALNQSLPDGDFLAVATELVGTVIQYYIATVDVNGVVTAVAQFPPNELTDTLPIRANDGNYYGLAEPTTASTGYVFRVTPSGAMTTLHSFPSGTFLDSFPAPLLQADDGNLYGVAPQAGANGAGIIYKLTLDGQYTLLYTFPDLNSGGPTALIEGSDGNLYGATLGTFVDGGFGQFFRISKSGEFESLYSLSEPARDGVCMCNMVLGSDGIIYGTTQGGGLTGAGAVFALDVGLPKPRPWAKEFGPQSGPAGTRVRIWGSNLLSPSVQFNGVPAVAVAGSGPNYVWATVPVGATTGPITVTTPGGTNTTHASFTVQ